jgi:EAL domain-containing protein (putative c-di-GMP-specific phosphodiesterase class I)
MVQILQAVKKFTDRDLSFGWISVYMPLRLLRRPDCLRIVNEAVQKQKVAPDKICFELSLALLDEKDSRCADSIRELRRQGYHILLTEVGSDSCPMMKLAAFNLDYIMLDSSVIRMLGRGEKADLCVKSMIAFINEYGAEPIACGVESDEINERLYDYECSYYAGDFAGNFVLERYIRRRD